MLYFLTDALVLGCINAIMVVGLNLQYGYSGLSTAVAIITGTATTGAEWT